MSIAKPDLSLLPEPAMHIGGDRVRSQSQTMHSHMYPATGQVTGQLPLANADDVNLAVAAARAAAPAWANMPANERRDILIRLGHLLRENAETLTQLSIIDNGIAIGTQQYGPHVAADLFLYNAGWTDKIGGEVIATWPSNALDYTHDEPYGVVAVIIPWNGPIYALGMTLAPALAAGNAVVVKPPELAPWAALHFGELCKKAGIPDGVVNIVPGGPEAGAALTAHRGVDKIQFTGSGETARHILSNAAANMTPVHLELGGKSASIIFADADLDSLDYFALAGISNNSGQGCINPTRQLVQSSIYDAFIERLVGLAQGLTVGDPMDPATIIGPVIDARAEARILGMIDRAKTSGARLIAGGAKMGGDFADGYFIAPTIFADVPHEAELSQCEAFGPLLAVSRFETEEDAIAIAMANGTKFGLAAYLWTNDLKRAHSINGRTFTWSGGKMLGGSSAINGMVYVRGQRGDYARWEAVGATGWGWDAMRPYYCKAENYTGPPSHDHGSTGPLNVAPANARHPRADIVKNAFITRGIAELAESCAGDQHGVYDILTTAAGGIRRSTAAAHLQDRGIAVRADLPVGQNLQEHVGINISKLVDMPTYNSPFGPFTIARDLLKWVFTKSGPMASAAVQVMVGVKSDPALSEPDLSISFLPLAIDLASGRPKMHKQPGITLGGNCMRPDSRGEIRLRSTNAMDKPMIDHRLLGDDHDLERLLVLGRFLESIYAAPPLAQHVVANNAPETRPESDEDWRDYIRATAGIGYHPVGTCAMGDKGVVDANLRVKEISGLRVVDASVMPIILSANTNAAVIAIAERAADLIKAEVR